MKSSRRPLAGLGVVVALTTLIYAFWQAQRSDSQSESTRRILYYQDSMHPWVKSDAPGKCTVCAMDLTPIYEGERDQDAGDDTIVLNRSSVTVLNVRTEQVRRHPLNMTVRVSGTLEPDETRTTVFASPSVGRIESMEVEYAGIEVEQGQRLLTFYSPELVALRRQYVVRGNSIVSLSQTRPLGVRETMPRSGGQQVMPAHAGMGANAGPALADVDPYYCDLLAPQSGTVVDRKVFPGQYVSEGEPMFTIVDMSVLWFRFDVYERQLPWLREGQEMSVSLAAVPGREFRAVISWIEPTVDPRTRTAKVRADIVNPREGTDTRAQHLLKLGMYADGWVHAEVPDVVSVPRSAILFPGGQAYAYVERASGAYTRIPVQLGRQGDDRWEILSGLAEGDTVVTAGNVLIDAQAQFTHSSSSGFANAGEGEGTSADGEPTRTHRDSMKPGMGSGGSVVKALVADLDDDQKAALSAFLELAHGMSAALAADDPGSVQSLVLRLSDGVAGLRSRFGEQHPWHPLVESIIAHSSWPAVTDLLSARQAFRPFSTAVVDLVQHLRAGQADRDDLNVYYCPMAPEPGLWFQKSGPLSNPYFGAKMLRCGEEVPVPEELKRAQHQTRSKPSADPRAMTHGMLAGRSAPRPSAQVHIREDGHHMTEPMHPEVSESSEVHTAAATNAAPSAPQRRRPVPAAQTFNSRSPERMERLLTVAGARLAQRQLEQQALRAVEQESAEAVAMHQMGARAAERVAHQTVSPPSLEPRQEELVRAFLNVAGEVSEVLASDDLEAYNQSVARLPLAVTPLVAEFRSPHPWSARVERLSTVSRASAAKDLEQARRQFLVFSTQVVEFGKLVIPVIQGAEQPKLFHCPMAPAPGVWLQSEGPLRNPYFGSRMLSCGEEIALKPSEG